MKELIIKSYIKNLTKDDIIKYAEKNNIILEKNEVDVLYSSIKNNYENILMNPEEAIKNIKEKVNINTYNKIYELYTIYYPKLYH